MKTWPNIITVAFGITLKSPLQPKGENSLLTLFWKIKIPALLQVSLGPVGLGKSIFGSFFTLLDTYIGLPNLSMTRVLPL